MKASFVAVAAVAIVAAMIVPQLAAKYTAQHCTTVKAAFLKAPFDSAMGERLLAACGDTLPPGTAEALHDAYRNLALAHALAHSQ